MSLLQRAVAGLIILEADAVAKEGRLANMSLDILSDIHIDGLKKVAEVCYKYDAVNLVQIHHAGT